MLDYFLFYHNLILTNYSKILLILNVCSNHLYYIINLFISILPTDLDLLAFVIRIFLFVKFFLLFCSLIHYNQFHLYFYHFIHLYFFDRCSKQNLKSYLLFQHYIWNNLLHFKYLLILVNQLFFLFIQLIFLKFHPFTIINRILLCFNNYFSFILKLILLNSLFLQHLH